jgi:hypothetical protein
LGNNTVEIVDLRAGKHRGTITGLHEPQGVGFVPEFNKIFVANGKAALVTYLTAHRSSASRASNFPMTQTTFDTILLAGVFMSVTEATGSALSIPQLVISWARSNSRATLNPSN